MYKDIEEENFKKNMMNEVDNLKILLDEKQ